jgi:hypothetical protein
MILPLHLPLAALHHAARTEGRVLQMIVTQMTQADQTIALGTTQETITAAVGNLRGRRRNLLRDVTP